jgi:hypothetical protein
MLIKINNEDYEVPFSTELVTLGQYINYQRKFGKDLDKELISIVEKYKGGNGIDYSLEIDDHIDKEALSWFSFWTGVDLVSLKGDTIVSPLLRAYRDLKSLFYNEGDLFPFEVEWQGIKWRIQGTKVDSESEMTLNEVVTSKEILRQTYKLGQSKWEAMPILCAIFFRKENEPFTDALIHPNSERMRIMREELPLCHANKVGFFLSVCVSTWRNNLLSSLRMEEGTQKNLFESFTKSGVGLTSLST